jgi:hypothetical protein
MRTFCSFSQEVAMLFFQFPEDTRWNAERDAVQFGVILGGYEGVVTVPKRVFQGLLDQSPTPQRCLEAFHLQRTRFEMIAERKLRRRQLTEDGNVEITGRDLREKTPPVGQPSLFERLTSGHSAP